MNCYANMLYKYKEILVIFSITCFAKIEVIFVMISGSVFIFVLHYWYYYVRSTFLKSVPPSALRKALYNLRSVWCNFLVAALNLNVQTCSWGMMQAM